MRAFIRFQAVIATLLVAACGGTDAKQAGRCATIADCQPGSFCNPKGFCQAKLGCHDNNDCAAGMTCDSESGVCLCTGDAPCGTGRFCNASHRCQDLGACTYNGDCPPSLICDTPTSKCIPAGTCASDTQCPLAQVCDPAQSVCIPACKTSGDCPQTAVNGSGVTVFAPQGCVGGHCQANMCTSAIGCPFGQFCTNNTCTSGCSLSTPYCSGCGGLFSSCGPGGHCLIDDRNDSCCTSNTNILDPYHCTCADPPNVGQACTCRFFCGVDCSGGKPCPSGYSCYGLVVVTPGLACGCPSTCANGTGPCVCNEGAASGYCKCVNSTDCGLGNTCTNGFCESGRACAPSKGYFCDVPGPACP